MNDSTAISGTNAPGVPPQPVSSSSPGRIRILVLAVAVGVVTGLATCVMKWGIKAMGSFGVKFLHADSGNWQFLILPLIGIVLAMIFQRYVMHRNLAHGTAMIRHDLAEGKYVLPPSAMYSSLIGCGITIGSGGSAGAEGPSAYTGAAVASNFSRWFGVKGDWSRIMLGVGAGAGIAGIFKSPIGGALFTLEVLGMPLTTLPVLILVICCLVSGGTALAIGGFEVDMPFADRDPFDLSNILWIVALGVFCGLYSLYYNSSKNFASRLLSRITNPWAKAAAGGLALSLAIYLFPSLFGEGYGMISNIINGRGSAMLYYSPFYGGIASVGVLVAGTVGVLLLKGMMVSATTDSGGVAGDFAPTLFAGCLAGYLFGMACNTWFGATLPAENFALLGMAAVMAGTIKAPLMAIFITCEMSDSYTFLFGFMVVAAVSYGVVWASGKAGNIFHHSEKNS